MSKVMAAPPLTAGWLENRTFDLGLVVGITLVAALVAICAGLDPAYLQMLVMADLWLLGYHHVIATFTKLAGTASDRRHNFALIWLLFPGVLIATALLGKLHGVIAIVTLYFFWQWFHYVRQSWGIAQRYRHRAGTMPWDNQRVAEITLWSVPIWGILHRCHQNSDTFLWMPVWMPAVSLWVVQLAGLASATLVCHWILTRLRAWRRGELPVGHTLYMASHFIVFACAYILIDDITLGWLMVNVWHNAQYLTFVWMHNRQRFSAGVTPDGPIISWLSQPGLTRASIYFGLCLLITTAVYTAIIDGSALIENELKLLGTDAGTQAIALVILFSMTINFHHYIVDSIIWKRKNAAKS